MGPFKPHYTNRVSLTLLEAEISNIAVVELPGIIRAVLMFRRPTTRVRPAIVVLLVGLGISSLLGSHPAYASAAPDASALTTARKHRVAKLWRAA